MDQLPAAQTATTGCDQEQPRGCQPARRWVIAMGWPMMNFCARLTLARSSGPALSGNW